MSCSHSTISRTPAALEQSCNDSIYNILHSKKGSGTNYFFRSVVKSSEYVDYHLNLERVSKYIRSLPHIYRNELSVKSIGHYDGEDILRIDIPGRGATPRKKVVITAGVHGNESAGVVTSLEFIKKNIYNPHVRNNFDIVIIPYLNPGGLKNNSRRLNNNIDLNRTFKKSAEQRVTNILRSTHEDEHFDLSLDLHEAPTRDKFFIIKSEVDDNYLTKNVLSNIDTNYLVTDKLGQYPGEMMSATSNKKAYDLYAPGEVASSNIGTVKGFYRHNMNVFYSYTLEAPGKFDLDKKIDIYTNIVEYYFSEFLKIK
ncbi:DUF2817 domain-containing protein [Halobacteriovorax sp. HLS]|uniref:DUF2817 domain-containing protein n=1 Tax=Halobacteriovorax sp. HLS TaxID=2234000 RepID=UPI0013E33F51|nr:DUF2817 domain-containing protein [Halobacteriovorax sp. HLS]